MLFNVVGGQLNLEPVQAPPGQPPGIWGPTDPRPTPPIYLPPQYPGGPPVISGPPGPWPTPPIYIPPGQPGQPPGIWGPPGPWPTPPIHIPPEQPGSPPGIWGPPGPWPTPPIHIPPPGQPSGPPVYQPLPPDSTLEPPSSAPDAPPDLASPGLWCRVVMADGPRWGYLQTALETDPDHEPRPPEKGLPGEWIAAYDAATGMVCNVWLPSSPPGRAAKK